MNYSILTYGCQMNVRDSEVIAGLMEGAGYSRAPHLEQSDVIIVNTCCVRESAERRILGRLGDLKRLKRDNPALVIAVGGCMTQQEGVSDRIRRSYPHVDVVFGTFNIRELPDLIRESRARKERLFRVRPCNRMEWGCEHPVISSRNAGVSAFVTVMYGCDNFCSYCIVPYVRGREVSRDPRSVLAEVEEAVSLGFKEVMLLGQNVSSYGKGNPGGPGFAGLLEMVDGVHGIERIRYMTSHPRDFSDDIIRAVAGSSHVCEHFHLPVQAGSNRVLRLMNRGYTREYYMDLIERVREAVPGASVTTDFIVGFPGETEADFEDTLDLVRRVRFDMAYTFMYSQRRGTRAAAMDGQVPLDERRRRLSALAGVVNPIALSLNEGLVGSTVEVLVEGPSEKSPLVTTGRTRTNKVVLIAGGSPRAGELVDVRITRARTWTLEGELVKKGTPGHAREADSVASAQGMPSSRQGPF